MSSLTKIHNEMECIICYNHYIPSKSNYKCMNIKCLEKICNVCLEQHLNYSKQCVFCRDILDLRYKIIMQETIHKKTDILNTAWPYVFCVILFIGWMSFMHTYCKLKETHCYYALKYNTTNTSNQNLQ